ncbi:hypothetical protein DL769_008416 [Monosporascus sp. CRB-8-3]|nr:hypothetical protein DL769_008416 [Monosporascus sp. CRB-8-3]
MDPSDPLAELITTYNELNASVVEELSEEPSPLEFMRYVSRNTPFVVRQGGRDWPATKKWTAAYLREALSGHKVNVAVTPFGNADAPTMAEDGELVFAKPHEEDQPFEDFLLYLRRQELDPSFRGDEEVRYAQTQNDNLRHEYVSLFSEVQKSVAFARVALDKEPDAINMWVGNSYSTTALHKDNYENVYVQVAGRKHFTLLPPLCQPCVNERELEPASYVRDGETGELRLRREEGGDPVPFAIWDPELPGRRSTKYSHLARPLEVTLHPGDMLYLPAMWYDMEFSGPLYPLCSFVRNVHHGSNSTSTNENHAG